MGNEGYDSFAEMLRAIAREVSDSVERAATELDLDELAGRIGVDPDRAREWVETAGEWFSSQVERAGDEMASKAGRAQSSEPPEDPWRSAAPHPLDLPSEEQGRALAALDSGRWTIEPGTETLATHGEGPNRSDALGIVRELRARDWIAADGEITLAGQHALSRWLDAAAHR